jgi:hypothetical protein
MDLSAVVIPKSDQLNSDDLIGGPRTFTITDVRPGSDEQPVKISLAEFPDGRPWKPNKTMCRVLMDLWGTESSVYIGRRVTLFREARVRFGPDEVGGVRISHMTDIGDKRRKVIVTVSKGKKGAYTVEPLADDAPTSPVLTETEVKINALRNEWKTADPDRKAEIQAEVAKLSGKAPEPTAVDPGDIPTPDPALDEVSS